MNDNANSESSKALARRRLIRGVFAAPTALTLFNGSAYAQASMTCIAKQVATPAYPSVGVVSMEPAVWLRVPLWILEEQNQGQGASRSTWVKGVDVVNLAKQPQPEVGSYLGGTDWQCISSSGTPAFIVGAKYTEPAPSLVNGSNVRRPTKGSQWVAVRVAANGSIIGVVGTPEPGGGSQLRGSAVGVQSCWASFVGMN